MKRSSILLYLLVSLPFTQAHAAQSYHFSFNDVEGTVSGTVKGTIRFDSFSSPTYTGTAIASEIRITSAPGSVPTPSQGLVLTDWTYIPKNTFTINNGVIVDYQFGAAVAPLSYAENVFCLNNDGGPFVFPDKWSCAASENWYGDGTDYVYNSGGIGAVTFTMITQPPSVPVPTLPLLGLLSLGGLIGFFGLRKLKK